MTPVPRDGDGNPAHVLVTLTAAKGDGGEHSTGGEVWREAEETSEGARGTRVPQTFVETGSTGKPRRSENTGDQCVGGSGGRGLAAKDISLSGTCACLCRLSQDRRR